MSVPRSLGAKGHRIAPTIPTPENTVRVIFQPSNSARGTAPAKEAATPPLRMAVLSELTTSISRGLNHCMTSGPVETTMSASPAP